MRSKAGPVNSYTFDLHDGFTGSHGNLADHLSAAKDLGKADEPLSTRSGPGRKVDRGTATPEETPAELRAKGWNRPAASVRGGGGGDDDDDDDGECPAGMYAASGLHHPAQRMGLETPRFKAVDACARCPTGRFGSGKGLRGSIPVAQPWDVVMDLFLYRDTLTSAPWAIPLYGLCVAACPKREN